MPFVWAIGAVIGPAVGGYFAEPVQNYPGLFHKGGLFGRYPYLLPNIICAGFLLASILVGSLLLEETHPDLQPWKRPGHDERPEGVETPIMPAQASTTTPAVNLTQEASYGTFNDVTIDRDEEWRIRPDGRASSISSASSSKVFTKRVVMLTVALGIFTYHSMTYDHLMPIFFQDQRADDISAMTLSTSLAGGLGLSTHDVGVIMSINGIIALFVQGVVFPLAASWLGIWKIFMVVTVLHPIAYFIVPYLVLLPHNLVLPGIYICLTVRDLLSILAYPVLLILIKEAAPSPSSLGRINGLAASTGAGCRTIASPLAGLLYSVGIQMDFTAIAWWASALIAILGAAQAFAIPQQKGDERHHVVAINPRRFSHVGSNRDVVHIVVHRDVEPGRAVLDDERQPLLEV